MKRLLTIFLLLLALAAHGQRYVKTFDTLTRALASNLNDVSTNFVTLGLTAVGDGGGASYWYDATRSDATNAYGVFTPASGTGRVFRYKDWDNDATSLYTVGDSFTYGAGATSYTNTYVSKFATSMGLPAINLANGSFTISDATWSTFSGWAVTNISGPNYEFSAPAEITENQTWTTLVGFNDLRTGSTSASMYRKGLDHLIHWLAIPATAKKAAQLSDSSTGTWTAIPWSNGMGTIGRYSSSGTLTFNNVMGSDVYVAYLGWGTNYGGNIAVSVDGSSITNFSTASIAYGNRTYINGSDASIPAHTGPYGNGKIDFCPQIVRVTDLGFGAHTVVVTASVNPVYVLWVGGNGFSRTPRKGPNVFVGSIPRQSPWTASGTDALHASYNSQIQQSVAAARASGLRVALAPVANDYLPSTMQSVDLVHPNNLGHTAIAGAFEKLLIKDLPSVAYGLGTAVTTSSGGSGGAGSFSTLAVSGTSTLVGNTTVNSRLLVLPSAVTAPGGYNSRFGYGSTTGSTISVNYGDSNLNRELYLYGNSIHSVTTSTGVAANLALGVAGTDVAIQGNETVAGTLAVTGAGTITGAITGHAGLTLNRTLSGSSGTENLAALNYTVNQTGTASSRGVNIALTSTAPGSGNHRFLTASDDGLDIFYVQTDGRMIINSPNGTTGVLIRGQGATDSQIFLQHAQTLDRRLTLTGNGVAVTDASGATPNNLFLGAAGTTTTIQGAGSVAQAFAVTGGTTLTGALVANGGASVNNTFTGSSGTETAHSVSYTVNQTGTASSRGLNVALTSTAAGSGTHRLISTSDDGTDRFWIQSDGRPVVVSPNGTVGMLLRGDGGTDSRIYLAYAATLDRQMNISGNQIWVRDANTGATANTLTLGETTSTVAIQGNETVGGTTTIGTTGTTTGSVGLKGSTSGTVTVSVAAAAGTHTIKLPTADGTANQVLKTDGSGQWGWTTAGSGSVATDSIFTTAGDLPVGTGSSASARLAAGDYGATLTANGAADALFYATPNNVVTVMEHFLSHQASATIFSEVFSSVSSTAGTGIDKDHPGVYSISTGVSSTATGYLRVGNSNGTLMVGGGLIVYEQSIKIPTLSDTNQTFTAQFGLSQPSYGANTSGNHHIKFVHDNTSANWQTSVKNNGTTTSSTSTTAVTTGWTKLRIVVNAAASSVSFYVNGTALSSSPITTNIPDNTDEMTMGFGITKSAGITARTIDTDYIYFYQKLANPL